MKRGPLCASSIAHQAGAPSLLGRCRDVRDGSSQRDPGRRRPGPRTGRPRRNPSGDRHTRLRGPVGGGSQGGMQGDTTRVEASDDAPGLPGIAVPAVPRRPTEPPLADAHDPQGPSIRRSAAILLLIGVVLAVAFAEFRGGLPYPLQPPPGSAVLGEAGAEALASPFDPSAPPIAAPATTSTPSRPSPSVSTPSPTPSPTPRPTPTPRPKPSSDRYALLVPCPDQAGCWQYTIRRGDNLFSIANWFGVSLDVVRRWNPWTRTQGLDPGRQLSLPRPTR